MKAYFSHHPLVLWAMILVGVPIGIVFAVGLTTTIFAMILLGLRSLMW